jgi:hypothetical protein
VACRKHTNVPLFKFSWVDCHVKLWRFSDVWKTNCPSSGYVDGSTWCEVLHTFQELTLSPFSGCASGLVGCEVFPTYWELTPSPSSGCAGGLVGCEGFLIFWELHPSPTSGCAGGFVRTKTDHYQFCLYQTTSTPWICAVSSPIHLISFTPWCGSLPHKISLNYCLAGT